MKMEATNPSWLLVPCTLPFHPVQFTTAPNTPKYSDAVYRVARPIAGRQHEEVAKKAAPITRTAKPRPEVAADFALHVIVH